MTGENEPGPGMCTCGARIRWVRTVAGALMPLDPDPTPDGTVVPVDTFGERRARVLRKAELELHNGARFRAHWSSCPHGPNHRRPTHAAPPAALAVVQGAFDVEVIG